MYGFKTKAYILTKEELARANFIYSTKKVMGMVRDQDPQDPQKLMALQSFEINLVKEIVERVGLADYKPIAVLYKDKLMTCYVGKLDENEAETTNL